MSTPLVMSDLLTGETYTWTSEWNYVRLEPDTRPAHVLVVELPAPTVPGGPGREAI